MDKFVKIFSSQNPKMELPCGNPNCKKKSNVKTVDFFSGKSYIFKCPHCGETTEFTNVETELNKLKKDFKKLGLTW